MPVVDFNCIVNNVGLESLTSCVSRHFRTVKPESEQIFIVF